MSRRPRVFISYSHDPPGRQAEIGDLACELDSRGLDIRLDQFESTPEEGWPRWATNQIQDADFVLVVCSEEYERRFRGAADSQKGKGVTWEGFIITQDLYNRRGLNSKFVPIVMEEQDLEHVPILLQGATIYRVFDAADFELLLSRLHEVDEASSGELGSHLFWEQIRAELPSYRSTRQREISEALAKAYLERAELTGRGEQAEDVQKQIITLRRQLREDGISPGDFLLDGRLLLQEEIGRGGFSTVWKAYDRKARQIVAVKILHSQYSQDQSRKERFFRGARKMASLEHPRIARVLEEYHYEEGYYFFLMEYLAGGDLRRAVLGNKLSEPEVLRIVVEVSEALAFAHGQQVFHRDVKPGNILLDLQLRPKLTDFDLVRAMDTTGGTRSGMLGTIVYAAPEVMTGARDAGAQADIYGLGMTAVFGLLGGEPGLPALRDAAGFIRKLEVSDGLKSVLSKAVAWDTSDRYLTVEDFLDGMNANLEKQRERVSASDVEFRLELAEDLSQSVAGEPADPYPPLEDVLEGQEANQPLGEELKEFTPTDSSGGLYIDWGPETNRLSLSSLGSGLDQPSEPEVSLASRPQFPPLTNSASDTIDDLPNLFRLAEPHFQDDAWLAAYQPDRGGGKMALGEPEPLSPKVLATAHRIQTELAVPAHHPSQLLQHGSALHSKALRLARILVDELFLYNQDAFKEAASLEELLGWVKDAFDRSVWLHRESFAEKSIDSLEFVTRLTIQLWLFGAPDERGERGRFVLSRTAVAARDSSVYHLGFECRDATEIRVRDRIYDDKARQNRRLHDGCPQPSHYGV